MKRSISLVAAGVTLAIGLTACSTGSSLQIPDFNTTPNSDTVDPGTPANQDDSLVALGEDGTFAQSDEEASTWDENDPRFGTPEYSKGYGEKAIGRAKLETRYGPAAQGGFTQGQWDALMGSWEPLPAGVESALPSADSNTVFAIAQIASLGWHRANATNAQVSNAAKLAVDPISSLATQTGQDSIRAQGQAIAAEVGAKGIDGKLSDPVAASWRLMPIGWCDPDVFKSSSECVLPSSDLRLAPESITSIEGENGIKGAQLTMVTTHKAYYRDYDFDVATRAVYTFWRNPDGDSPATWSLDGVTVDGWEQTATRSPKPSAAASGQVSTVSTRTGIAASIRSNEDDAGDNETTPFPGGGGCVVSCSDNPPGPGDTPDPGTGGGGGGFTPPCPANSTFYVLEPPTYWNWVRNETRYDPISQRNWPKYVGIQIEYTWELSTIVSSPGMFGCETKTTGNFTLVENTTWPQMMPPIECPTGYSSALKGPYNRQMQETENFKVFSTGTNGQVEKTLFGQNPNARWQLCLDGTAITVKYDDQPNNNGRYLGNLTIKSRFVNYYYVPDVSIIFGNWSGTYQLSSIGDERSWDRDKRWVMNCNRALFDRSTTSWGDGGDFYNDNRACPTGRVTETRYEAGLVCPTVSNPYYTPALAAGPGENTFQTRGVVDVRANNQQNQVEWRFPTGTQLRTTQPNVNILGYAWSTKFQFPEGLDGIGQNSPSLNPEIWRKKSMNDANSSSQPYRVATPGDEADVLKLNTNIGPYAEPSALGIDFRGQNDDFLLPAYGVSFADASTTGSYWGVTPLWTVDAVITTPVWEISGIEVDLVAGQWVVTPIFERETSTIEVNRNCTAEQSKMRAVRVASGDFGRQVT